MSFSLPFGQSGQPMTPAAAQQRSKYLTDAMNSLQASSRNIQSPGELGSRLLAQALLKWGRDRADGTAGDPSKASAPVDPSGGTGLAPSQAGPASPIATQSAGAPKSSRFGFQVTRPSLQGPVNPFGGA